MPNYRSLIGGYFSSTPGDKTSGPVSIRYNNAGAVNGAAWERTYPGYVGEVETTPGNRSTIFETPEQGIAVWWDLMRRYRASGVITVGGIINRYGGGQDYSVYVAKVIEWTGLSAATEIKLYGDDATLLKFAKAMFRYEAGRAIPWSDEQILYGFDYGRKVLSGSAPTPAEPTAPPAKPPEAATPWWLALLQAILELFKARPPVAHPPALTLTRILKPGDVGDDVRALQVHLVGLGYIDLVLDGTYGAVTQKAVRAFQTARNLDPDGEVGELTLAELNRPDARQTRPPLLPPTTKYGKAPTWYGEAEKWIGFRETGVNRGIEQFIAGAKCGQLGDPWCAIFVNFCLETVGVPGSRSAMARSFETHSAFVRLSGPALGAIVTMWRTSPSSGSGHVFVYDGENSQGVRGIGANESDQVKKSIHERSRITGYWWPKGEPLPQVQPIPVGDQAAGASGSET